MTCAIEEPQVRFSSSKETRLTRTDNCLWSIYVHCSANVFFYFFFLLLQSKISFAAASRKHVSYGWKRRKFSRLSQPEFFRGIHICTVRDFKTQIVLSWTNLFRCFVIFHFRWRYSMYLYQVLCTANLMCDLKWNILNNSRSVQY